MPQSFLTPKARTVTTDRCGNASVVVKPIRAGEVVAAFGGDCMARDQFDTLDAGRMRRSIQIADDLFLAGPVEPDPADFINHSCEPSCGMSGDVTLVALRDLAPGDEITYDYAMSDGSDYDEFECSCGTASCRGKVTGNDWMLPELQLRYRGHFSGYLARRISSLVSVGAERRAFAL
jgi:hypothetical protein